MIPNELYSVLRDSYKVLLLLGGGTIIASVVIGVLSSLFQALIALDEETISYALKLSALIFFFSVSIYYCQGLLVNLYITSLM